MWNLYGIEPEVFDYKTTRVIASAYHLRPEIVESTYYLYHYTRAPEYRQMGAKLFTDFVHYCRTDSGYAALEDIVTKQNAMRWKALSSQKRLSTSICFLPTPPW